MATSFACFAHTSDRPNGSSVKNTSPAINWSSSWRFLSRSARSAALTLCFFTTFFDHGVQLSCISSSCSKLVSRAKTRTERIFRSSFLLRQTFHFTHRVILIFTELKPKFTHGFIPKTIDGVKLLSSFITGKAFNLSGFTFF